MNKKFTLTILFAFLLNLIWEFSHYHLYYDLTGIPKIPHLILASFTDMIIITCIFLIISYKNKTIKWINKPFKKDYYLIITFSLIIAILIELYSVGTGRWNYTPAMPTIFGIGLSPLLQLATTAVVSLLIIRFSSSSANLHL